MAMTPQEMIEFFGQQAALWSNGLRLAVERKDYHQATLCVGQVFKGFLMQGLIAWRIGQGSPVEALKSAVRAAHDGAQALDTLPAANPGRDVPLHTASFVAYLVDMASPPVVTSELTADSLLDAVLANGLRDTWDAAAWNRGIEQLKKNKRAALAVETYAAYERLLHGAAGAAHADFAAQLFQKRARDGFYKGGDQSAGGGPDNAFTIDYRLAAVMKKVGYAGENLHQWRAARES
jgi:hypothetical protein